jgi:hypothetical protein
VECKTQTETLQADVINKLHTDVSINEAHCGWIFAVADLGKEAKARLDKLNGRGGGDIYKFFSASALVQSLIDSKAIKLPRASEQFSATEILLCVFEDRLIWSVPKKSANSNRPIGHLAWDAIDGSELEPKNAPDVVGTDFPFPELGWLEHQRVKEPNLREQQPVVEVIPGEEWSDYRPSRPDDFVGRQGLISEIGSFFERIKNGETSSRLFGIKGQSGWGKSSLAIKLAQEMRTQNVIILPVDCRAAKASYYADLVVDRALQAAAQALAVVHIRRQTRASVTHCTRGEVLHQDPFSGHLFVFRGRKANLLKIVFWDGSGLCLFTKRLEQGVFLWPPEVERGRTLPLTSAQLSALIDGVDWRAPQQWRPAVAG